MKIRTDITSTTIVIRNQITKTQYKLDIIENNINFNDPYLSKREQLIELLNQIDLIKYYVQQMEIVAQKEMFKIDT